MPPPSGYTAILDGYNIIKRHPQWAARPLVHGRQQLVEFVAQLRWPVRVGRILVVFDTQDPQPGGDYAVGSVAVRFASPSADAAIQELLRTNPQPRYLLIVSDDREILQTARAHGARCCSSAWLWQARATTGRAAAPESKAGLPAAQARAITEELARRWLGRPTPPSKP